jgi:hypothetical protein
MQSLLNSVATEAAISSVNFDAIFARKSVPATATCNTLIESIRARLERTLATDRCRLTLGDPGACVTQLKDDLGLEYKTFQPSLTCSAEAGRTAALKSERVWADLTRVTGTTTLNNAPPQRFTFGLGVRILRPCIH